MKKNISKFLKNFSIININIIFLIFSNLNKIVESTAAFLLNIFFLFEIISRVVIFVYYVKNIIYFLYINQRKQFFYNNKNSLLYFFSHIDHSDYKMFYSKLNIFYKMSLRPFNYSFLYTFTDISVVDYREANAFFLYKIDFIERFYMLISNFFEFEKQYINSKFEKNNRFSFYRDKIKHNSFTKFALFTNYNYFSKINKISYIYSNNLFILNFFFFLLNLKFTDLEDFLNLRIREIKSYFIFFTKQESAPLRYSAYVGFYRNIIFSIIHIYNIFVLFQYNFIYVQLLNIYKFSKEYIEWDFVKLEIQFLTSFYIHKLLVNFIDNIVNIINDVKKIVKTIIEDFTLLDLFKYIFFLNEVSIININSYLFSEIIVSFFYIKKELKYIIFNFYYLILENVVSCLYFYFRIGTIFFFIQLCILLSKNVIKSLVYTNSLYLSFMLEIYECTVYFLEIFYYFITSSFYSEHILVLILIEFFLELFGLSINSIEFIISIIFIVVSSILVSQFLDFFENYNIEMMLETFSFFFFSFSFLYEQQKILISALSSKLKFYKLAKYLFKLTSKFKQVNKQNLKISILIEKIKKIKKNK